MNIRDDISTQYNIVICICYIDVYIGVMIVLEGCRGGEVVWDVGVTLGVCASFRLSFYNILKYLGMWLV